jgi:hypothetical protein
LTITPAISSAGVYNEELTISWPGGFSETMPISFILGHFLATSPAAWAAALNDIANGGNNQNYTIVLTDDLVVPGLGANVYSFGSAANITVTITGSHELALDATSEGALLRTNDNQNIILQDVELVGHSDNNNQLVVVSGTPGIGSSVTMNGSSSISGNTIPGGHGAAVWINNGGTFTMNSGTITGNFAAGTNTGNGGGGGVYVYTGGTFIMNGGSITGNFAGYDGGGVYLGGGTFTLNTPASQASVSGNTSTGTYQDVGISASGGTIDGTAGVTAGW